MRDVANGNIKSAVYDNNRKEVNLPLSFAHVFLGTFLYMLIMFEARDRFCVK